MSKGSFILEGSTGKVGSLVVQRRKGSTILKEYVKPSNPKTQRQIAQRVIFATVQQAAKFMKPIIDHSFEGLSVGQESINRFAKVNLDRLRGYSVVDFAETTSAANSKCFMTTKGISALIPNKYIISQGSLDVPSNAKNGYVAAEGINKVMPFKANTSAFTTEGKTLGSVLSDLFGITKAGQQITKCVVMCSFTNPRYVFANDPDSPGFVIANSRFAALRLVIKDDVDMSQDVHSLQDAALVALVKSAFNTQKSDVVLLDWIDETLVSADGTASLTDGEFYEDMFDGFCAAEATIISEQYAGSWLRSNSEMALPNPPMQSQNYGLYWNAAVQAWLEESANAESRLFLEKGGDQNQVGF